MSFKGKGNECVLKKYIILRFIKIFSCKQYVYIHIHTYTSLLINIKIINDSTQNIKLLRKYYYQENN